MTESALLHLVSMEPNLGSLNEFGARRGVVPPGGDLGYALHAALAALFGAAAPKPFRLADRHGCVSLLGYTACDAQALQDYAALQAASCPDFARAARALGLEDVNRLVVRPMPQSWSAGRRYRFETRVRPVVRTTRNDPLGGGREIDAFIVAAKDGAPLPEREAVYVEWLTGAIARTGGARTWPSMVAIKAMKRTRLHTGDNRGVSCTARVEGPDVVATGILEVSDPEKFAALLARGVGRHRAFGFGMLLLAPAG